MRASWNGSGCAIVVSLALTSASVFPAEDPTTNAAGKHPDPFQPTDALASEAVQWLNEQAPNKKYPLYQDPARIKTVREANLAWCRKMSVEAFERIGNTKAPWADKARKALELRAKLTALLQSSQRSDTLLYAAAVAALREAVSAGCDDPLVLYYWLQDVKRHEASGKDDYYDELPRMGEALFASKYPDIRKLNAAHNFYAALLADAKTVAERKGIAVWRERFWDLLDRCCADPDPFVQADVAHIAALRETLGRGTDPNGRQDNYREMAARLEKSGAAKYNRLLLEGRFLIQHAWAARGNGAAQTVTEQGWKDFHDRLEQAKTAFTQAWTLDKLRPEAPTGMITVCMGLPLERPEMEKWFDRAMKADPDHSLACTLKLEYLMPKWHGSMEEYLGFGWQCVQTRNTTGGLLWVPIDHHMAQAPFRGPRFLGERDSVRHYYEHPVIWQQVATAYEVALAEQPANEVLRSNYARVACVAGKYDVANREFDRLGTTYSVKVFPTKNEYNYFRSWAKEKKPSQ